MQHYTQGTPQTAQRHMTDITLDSSFFLIPKEEIGQRISLNDPAPKSDPYDQIKELEKKVGQLQLQLDQSKKINHPKGVTNLMSENTKLKRSIIDFSNHLHKHNQLRRTMTIPGQGNKPNEFENQNNDLIIKIASLERELLKKDKQIEELSGYRDKWFNLKREASERKKQRESSISPNSAGEGESHLLG